MQRAVAGLHIAPDYVVIDGNRCPKLPMPSMAVVKGDSRVPEISAASILAKVTRDAEMAALDIVFPQYGFADCGETVVNLAIYRPGVCPRPFLNIVIKAVVESYPSV
eukprot:352993_1